MRDSSFLYDRQQVELFKNWIRRRFIDEADLYNMSFAVALAWCEAFKEMSTIVRHEIVPFRRRGGDL